MDAINTQSKKFLGWILALALILGAGFYLFERNIGTVNIPGDKTLDITGKGETGGDKVVSLPGFKLPAGFSLSIFAKNVPDARVIEIGTQNEILVSETSEGKIVALEDTNNDGVADKQTILASGLNHPHGLAMNCRNVGGTCYLYVAEADALSRYEYVFNNPQFPAPLSKKEKLISINYSKTDRHFTRSLLFLPSPNEDTLLVSVGSSCNVCNEKDSDHAAILSYNIKTGKKEVYAKGLRNATFMALNPVSGKIYATEMGRDNLGDNLPPDEINIIGPSAASGQNSVPNFGWPICYGKNIHDEDFDPEGQQAASGAGKNTCASYIPSFIDFPAHSAPLGLAFIPEESWPQAYWYSMLVAYHGSWNRSTPTGYKIARVKMNAKGQYLGTEDFITGWLTEEGKKTGRPVDIKVLSGGTAYISDDDLGVIYRLSRSK